MFHHGRFSRDISINANYLAVFKYVRDKNQFTYSPHRYIPKTATDCVRAISTLREDRMVICCSISHRTRTIFFDF